LKASSAICDRVGEPAGAAAWAPACANPGRPQAAASAAARSAAVAARSADVVEGLEAAAARADIPVPPLTRATQISHAIVAPATTSLTRLAPICMSSPFPGLKSLA
jgi:hypothetical protein